MLREMRLNCVNKNTNQVPFKKNAWFYQSLHKINVLIASLMLFTRELSRFALIRSHPG